MALRCLARHRDGVDSERLALRSADQAASLKRGTATELFWGAAFSLSCAVAERHGNETYGIVVY